MLEKAPVTSMRLEDDSVEGKKKEGNKAENTDSLERKSERDFTNALVTEYLKADYGKTLHRCGLFLEELKKGLFSVNLAEFHARVCYGFTVCTLLLRLASFQAVISSLDIFKAKLRDLRRHHKNNQVERDLLEYSELLLLYLMIIARICTKTFSIESHGKLYLELRSCLDRYILRCQKNQRQTDDNFTWLAAKATLLDAVFLYQEQEVSAAVRRLKTSQYFYFRSKANMQDEGFDGDDDTFEEDSNLLLAVFLCEKQPPETEEAIQILRRLKKSRSLISNLFMSSLYFNMQNPKAALIHTEQALMSVMNMKTMPERDAILVQEDLCHIQSDILTNLMTMYSSSPNSEYKPEVCCKLASLLASSVNLSKRETCSARKEFSKQENKLVLTDSQLGSYKVTPAKREYDSVTNDDLLCKRRIRAQSVRIHSLIRAGNFNTALQLYETLPAEDKFYDSQLMMVYLNLELGQYSIARQACIELLRLKPFDITANIYLADALVSLGLMVEALEPLDLAIRSLLKLRSDEGKGDGEGERHFKALLSLAYNNKALLLICGVVQEFIYPKNLKQAENLLLSSLELLPAEEGNTEAAYNLVALLYQQGRKEEASSKWKTLELDHTLRSTCQTTGNEPQDVEYVQRLQGVTITEQGQQRGVIAGDRWKELSLLRKAILY